MPPASGHVCDERQREGAVTARWVLPLAECSDRDLVGGKALGLHRLLAAGARVPAGFVVTTDAFGAALGAETLARLEGPVRALAPDAPLDVLEQAAAEVRAGLLAASAASPVLRDVRAAYEDLGGEVAVRSSAAAEDSADASYAGEHDTYLGVRGADAVADAVCRCWASLFTARAVSYRKGRPAGGMAVVVQRLVAARAAGVFMTLNPANGDRSTLVCEAVWGLGEPLVSGEVTPDRFVVDKVSGDVVRREIATKPTQLVRAEGGGTRVVEVPAELRDAPCLTDAELAELRRIGRVVERAAACPQDGEFAVDEDGVHLLQTRPETVWSRRKTRPIAPGRTALGAVLATLTGARQTGDDDGQ
jgi:pyruvate,water dikinase